MANQPTGQPTYLFATLPAGTFVGQQLYTSDQNVCQWTGSVWSPCIFVGSAWVIPGSGGGGSVGPTNTPGVGGAVVTDAAPGQTLTDYAPTGFTDTTSEIRINTNTGLTTLNSIVAGARASGSMLHVLNVGNQGLVIPHLGSGTTGNQFRVSGQASIILAIEEGMFVERDNVSNCWRPA